ncbi:MAG: MATE family efflux transporter [Lachnospiraceae bacterium]|uniref:MATE family efflux transporter n=1 Tax=Candidatus Weimeria bifida TaxID=2599074 RepID=A0A6N7J0G4_9FIRM|nr:MATE family efflux transporter [Candidatus Weimeria bifida]RRF95457.1 MAG: MATE family efflux transporter [Lachnospiraceae bacterium]
MEKSSENKNQIVNGVIWKQILIFFFPILVGAVFQTLYNTVDAVVVGRFSGKTALASVGGSSGQIVNFIFSFFMGLSSGATVVIAQAYGAEDHKRVDEALHTAYSFALTGGIVLGVLGVIFSDPLLMLLQTPKDLFVQSEIYVRLLLGGLVFTLIYNVGSAILRAIGDSRRPLYILIVCCVLNIVLDLLFVAVFHLGVFGAGFATVISQTVSAILITWLLMKKTPGMALSLRRLHMNKSILKKILQIGLPTAISGSMFSISNMILQTAINHMGSNTVAAWTAYGRIDAFWWMIDQAFCISITTFVGQNYGADKPDRIKKGIAEVIVMEAVLAVAIGILVVNAAPILLSFFTKSKSVIEIGATISHEIAPFYWTFIVSEILSSSLRAENYVMVTTITNLLGICLFRIIWVHFMASTGAAHLLYCYPISYVITSVFVLIYFAYRQPKIFKKMARKAA